MTIDNEATNFGSPKKERSLETGGSKRSQVHKMPALKVDTGNTKATLALKALNINQPLALNEAPIHSESSYNATAVSTNYPWTEDRKASFTVNRLSMLEEMTRESSYNGLRAAKQSSVMQQHKTQRASEIQSRNNNLYGNKSS